jgi:predicted exporter
MYDPFDDTARLFSKLAVDGCRVVLAWVDAAAGELVVVVALGRRGWRLGLPS